ncbi:hypothetical protein RCL_jg20525.t1 [Rhizophagus clarus]|uniref:Uncharacterized protein n=1 Tax=Rhizophagus clarus TaxID=94130 RepID=A0A8H3QUH4_9GLOM|nr:hypothetical protein RCL_jg20525.t1 [Rhizophagus clarus]
MKFMLQEDYLGSIELLFVKQHAIPQFEYCLRNVISRGLQIALQPFMRSANLVAFILFPLYLITNFSKCFKDIIPLLLIDYLDNERFYWTDPC